MNKIFVTIYSANEKEKIDAKEIECQDLIEATRVILSFKGKRGYKMFQCQIDVWEVME